jgi:hypothetical protein
MQEQIININDEIVITQFLQMFKNIFMNISIFILCIFLFMNPVLLVNALLFISIFLFVKACFSYLAEDTKLPTLQEPSIETEIKIFDESDLLRDRIRKLKRENTVLRDRLDRTDRKHKKRQNIHPPFTFEPFKINVDFLDIENKDINVKNEVKDDEVKDEEIKDDEVKNDEVKDDEVKDEEIKDDEVKNDEVKDDEVKDEIDDTKLSLDLEKIITDAINDMINSHDIFKERDGFAILSPIPSTPTNTDDDDEDI